jgi:AraC-like DNA-binding protein
MTYGTTTLQIKQGDVWFIPQNLPYKSQWTPDEYIELYYFEFEADYISNDYHTPQVISGTNMGDLFIKLFDDYVSDNSFGTLCSFYRILELIVPKLEKQAHFPSEKILPALKYINENYSNTIKIESLANLCFLSPSRFYTIFKEVTGFSPIEYKNNIKLSHAVQLLRSGYTLENICEELSFSSPAFLRRLMKKHFGTLPKKIKSNLPKL